MPPTCRRRFVDAEFAQEVSLTDRGHQFATWLVERGHKALFLDSDIGKWGTPVDTLGELQKQIETESGDSKNET